MIKQINPHTHTADLLRVINSSFLTVAAEFGITPENAPKHPAFMSAEDFLAGLRDKYVEFYAYEVKGALAGTVAVTRNAEGRYYIERLSVLPEHRHAGIGSELM